MVGMTPAELRQAMGQPDKVNAAQYGERAQDQLVYYRPGQTIYVYTKEGEVTSFQNAAGSPVEARKSCPT